MLFDSFIKFVTAGTIKKLDKDIKIGCDKIVDEYLNSDEGKKKTQYYASLMINEYK